MRMDSSEADVSHFARNRVSPSALPSSRGPHGRLAGDGATIHFIPHGRDRSLLPPCSCDQFKISTISPSSMKITPLWQSTAGYDPRWSLAEVKREEQRRLVWSALALTTECNAQAVFWSQRPLILNLSKPWLVRAAVAKLFYRPTSSLQLRS